MIRRLTYMMPLLLAGVLSTLVSCQDEETFGGQGAESGRLVARKVAPTESRSESGNSYFNEKTRYRLWAYNEEGYMFDKGTSSQSNGVLAQESSGHYVWLDQSNAAVLSKQFKVFGFTDGVTYLDDNEAVANGTLFTKSPELNNDTQKPTYSITYDPTIPEGHPDYMRAYLSYNSENGHDPVMEFKHIFSRVRVQVIQQGKDEDATQGLYTLKLHIAKLVGVYNKEIFDVRGSGNYEQGTFTVPDGEPLTERQLRAVGEGLDIIPADATKAEFSTSYVFPTNTNVTLPNSTMHHRLKLYISGTDAATFTGETEEVTDENGVSQTYHVVTVDLTDTQRNPDGTTDTTTPLVFLQNHSYMLRVVFAEKGLVTLEPRMYPWFDGETEGWEDGEGYEEQVIGNTLLFDNLIWSDRNLGAENHEAVDKESFLACTGFYYQYDRNIPYFPMVWKSYKVDGKTYYHYVDSVAENISVMPVVSNLQGNQWFQSRVKGVSVWDRVEPEEYPIKDFITKVEDIHEVGAANNKNLGYNPWRGGFDTGLWSDVKTQPVPPGWRLPTQQEFFGILPSTPMAGNLTFKRDVSIADNGDAGKNNEGAYFTRGAVDVIYVHVPRSTDYPDYPNHDDGLDTGRNTDGIKYAFEYEDYGVKGDPSEGDSSEYIISRFFPDECGTVPSGYANKWGWGTIYGIKKVGTNEAYRMRWSIRKIEGGNYYVLDIERYTATSTDRLSRDDTSPNYYHNYDWDRPVATLTIPIVGMIGDAGWLQRAAKVGNFGMETILATSERGSNPAVGHHPVTADDNFPFPYYKTYRIKICGSDAKNQFLYPAEDRVASGAQIRLVRESTYQPGNN